MAPELTKEILGLALFIVAGGILPAAFWLWFWLKEDSDRPEPKGVILRAFVLGGLAVLPAYLLERLVVGEQFNLSGQLVSVVITWSLIEEGVKFGAAYLGALRSSWFDEPVDAMVYLITAALGFAAVENILFMWNAVVAEGGDSLEFILTGNFRFIGATVIHIVASAVLGAAIGLAFYARPWRRLAAWLLGLAGAVALHALFNYSIITQGEGQIMTTFVILWFLALLVILLFEKVKETIIRIKLRQF